MRVACGVVLALAVTLGPGRAPGQEPTIAELNEKIEQMEFGLAALREQVARKNTNAGYEEGDFFLRSHDGSFSLTPSAAFQFQHRVQDIEGVDDTNDFFIRRARLKFEGNLFSEDLEYEIEFDMGTPDPGDPQFDLKDFYLDYRLAESLRVKLGQFKTPFGFQELTSSKKQQLVDRSLASEEFVPGRDLGVMLWGPYEGAPIEYSLGAFNGSGDNNLNANRDALYAARIAFSPLGRYKEPESDLEASASPRLTFGLEGFYNRDDTADDDIFASGIFAGFKQSGFSLRGEYFVRRNQQHRSTDPGDRDAEGYYAQLGYFVVPQRVEVALRNSVVRRSGKNDNEHEYTAGVNYFWVGSRAKLQLDYSRLIDGDGLGGGDDQESHRIRSQVQVYF